MKNYKKKNGYALTIISKEMQKSTTFTTILRVKKCYFHYDFACKKVPLSLRYAKKYFSLLLSGVSENSRPLIIDLEIKFLKKF
jgi:hypothetical protein